MVLLNPALSCQGVCPKVYSRINNNYPKRGCNELHFEEKARADSSKIKSATLPVVVLPQKHHCIGGTFESCFVMSGHISYGVLKDN